MLEARGEERRIHATYRSLGTPVSRTVDLPADTKRAHSIAVLLAGNVAREEADELLNGLKKNAGSSATTPSPTAPREVGSEDVTRLRTILEDLSKDESDVFTWVGVTSLAEGALAGGLGAYYLTRLGQVHQLATSSGTSANGAMRASCSSP